MTFDTFDSGRDQGTSEWRLVVVTGASGFIGHWIAQLAPPDVRLRVLARPTSDLSRLPSGIEVATGDLLDRDALRAALDGVDAVIHAAGIISFDRRDAERVRRANLVATQNLFEVARQLGIGRIVHTASIFALGHADPALCTGHEPFNARALLDIPYVAAKHDIELMSEAMLAEGLPLVRLYPGLCLGPEDRTQSSSGVIAAWLRGQVPAITRGGICYMDVRDAAAAHWAALARGEVGQRYLLPGTNLTHRQLFTRLAALTGRRAPPLTVPVPLAVTGAALMQRLMAEPPLRPDMARLMGYRWWYEDTATQSLGLSLRHLDETLHATLAELR